MALFLIFFGAICLVAAVKGTQDTLWSNLKTDVNGYYKLALAIVLLGAIGYIPKLKPVSIGLLVLFLIGILESKNGGVLANLISQLDGGVSNQSSSGATMSY